MGHKSVGNQVLSVLVAHETIWLFSEISQHATKVKNGFFCGQSLSFLYRGFGMYSKQEGRNRSV